MRSSPVKGSGSAASSVERGLLDHNGPASGFRPDCRTSVRGDIRVLRRAESIWPFTVTEPAEHVEKHLGRARLHAAARLELDSVFREARAARGRSVHDRRGVPHARQGGAHKGVRREQKVIAASAAAGVAQIIIHLPVHAALLVCPSTLP